MGLFDALLSAAQTAGNVPDTHGAMVRSGLIGRNPFDSQIHKPSIAPALQPESSRRATAILSALLMHNALKNMGAQP